MFILLKFKYINSYKLATTFSYNKDKVTFYTYSPNYILCMKLNFLAKFILVNGDTTYLHAYVQYNVSSKF